MEFLLEHLPSTLIGLLGLIVGVVYLLQKQKNSNELKQIQELSSADRPKLLEQKLNDFGTTINTDDLSPDHKYDLLKRLMNNKLKKYLISALTLIAFGVILFFVLGNDPASKIEQEDEAQEEVITPVAAVATNTFSLSTGDKAVDDSLKAMLVGGGFELDNVEPFHKIEIKSSLEVGEKPIAGEGNVDSIPYFYDEKPVKLRINDNDFPTGIVIPKTDVKNSHPEARSEHERQYALTLNQNLDTLYQLIYENLKK